MASYVYDSLDRLVRVSQAGVTIAQFCHDARGRRILEVVNGERTQLIHDGPNLAAEYRNGQPFAQYVHDDAVDRPLQIAAADSEHWYHPDLVGSTRLLTDQTGNWAAGYWYAPFGQSTAGTSGGQGGPYNPLRYTGRRFDEHLAAYDHRSRQYVPALGRFIQRDPLGGADGTNRYAYTRNNPLTFVDAHGTAREEVDTHRSLEWELDLLLFDDLDPAFDEASAYAWMRQRAELGLPVKESLLARGGRGFGNFAKGVIVDGGGWWLESSRDVGSTFAYEVGGFLELINTPIELK